MYSFNAHYFMQYYNILDELAKLSKDNTVKGNKDNNQRYFIFTYI